MAIVLIIETITPVIPPGVMIYWEIVRDISSESGRLMPRPTIPPVTPSPRYLVRYSRLIAELRNPIAFITPISL
ncbi:hypothetical protein D3C75_1357330 [compost metagenome]